MSLSSSSCSAVAVFIFSADAFLVSWLWEVPVPARELGFEGGLDGGVDPAGEPLVMEIAAFFFLRRLRGWLELDREVGFDVGFAFVSGIFEGPATGSTGVEEEVLWKFASMIVPWCFCRIYNTETGDAT